MFSMGSLLRHCTIAKLTTNGLNSQGGHIARLIQFEYSASPVILQRLPPMVPSSMQSSPLTPVPWLKNPPPSKCGRAADCITAFDQPGPPPSVTAKHLVNFEQGSIVSFYDRDLEMRHGKG
jgi:hypothetical protein